MRSETHNYLEKYLKTHLHSPENILTRVRVFVDSFHHTSKMAFSGLLESEELDIDFLLVVIPFEYQSDDNITFWDDFTLQQHPFKVSVVLIPFICSLKDPVYNDIMYYYNILLNDMRIEVCDERKWQNIEFGDIATITRTLQIVLNTSLCGLIKIKSKTSKSLSSIVYAAIKLIYPDARVVDWIRFKNPVTNTWSLPELSHRVIDIGFLPYDIDKLLLNLFQLNSLRQCHKI